MILTDTGPLVALFNRTDGAHEGCVDIFKDINESVATTLRSSPRYSTCWGRPGTMPPP